MVLLAALSAMAQETKPECPKIEVTGPAGVVWRGEEMTFTANVVGAGADIRYDWTVSIGRVVKGEGTASIVVVVDESNTTVKATVEVSGLPEGCEAKASESGGVAPTPGCNAPLDEWGPSLRPNDVRSRLDVFFAELSNNPKSKGIIIFSGVPSRNVRSIILRLNSSFRTLDLENSILNV